MITGVLQRFYKQSLAGIGDIISKFSYLIDLSFVGELKGDGKYLVSLDTRLEGDISHGRIERILGTGQETGRGKLFVVDTSCKVVDTVEDRGGHVDVTCLCIGRYHTVVFAVGIITRNVRDRAS